MLDFVRLCREKNIPYLESGHHHCHEGWIQTHCPFCADGSWGWRLGFSLEKGNMNCWVCGSHSVYDFLKIVLKQNPKQILKEYFIETIYTKAKLIKPRIRKVKKPPFMEAPSKIHKEYLLSRNFEPNKIITEWELQATKGLSGNWSWRIIAPIRDKENYTVSYSGRSVSKKEKTRWKHSKKEDMSVDPKTLLYGIEKIYNDRVIIVEGIADVWRLGPGAVATLGIGWHVEQAFILKSFNYRFIMYDPEPQAQKQAKKLADWLSPFPGTTEIISDLNSDPGDLDQTEAHKIMNVLGF